MADILTEKADRVLTLRFNRPQKKNALTPPMYDALAEAIHTAAADADVRVLLIAGQPDCFCAGNDMGDFLNNPPEGTDTPVARFMHALHAFEKPVVAAPSGIAVGVGVTLLLHCDLVYCGENTKLSLPFAALGFCPEYAATYLLPRIMGHQRAAELVMLGEPFSAQKALEVGLVNGLRPNAEVEAHARQQALKMAALPPNALKVTKQLMRRWTHATAKEAIDVEASHFIPMLKMPEAREAFIAFAEKRKPDFSRF
jgi:enoyl-CoA hydratase/carnithine racemase